jgi:SAM-dependent methyltransferase
VADDFEQQVCDIAGNDADALLARVVAGVVDGQRGVLVDLGCGIGTFIARFGRQFRQVIGVEYCPQIIERARRTCAGVSHVTWLCVDIPKVPNQFQHIADLTVCLNVITSPSSARRSLLWATIARITKRRGAAIVVVPALESALHVAQHEGGRVRSLKRAKRGDLMVRSGASQKFFERSEVQRLMETHGFTSVRVVPIRYPWSEEGLSNDAMPKDDLPWDWLAVGVRRSHRPVTRPQTRRSKA